MLKSFENISGLAFMVLLGLPLSSGREKEFVIGRDLMKQFNLPISSSGGRFDSNLSKLSVSVNFVHQHSPSSDWILHAHCFPDANGERMSYTAMYVEGFHTCPIARTISKFLW